MRDSSCLTMIPALIKKGAKINYFDPTGEKPDFKKFKKECLKVGTTEEALANAEKLGLKCRDMLPFYLSEIYLKERIENFFTTQKSK